MRLGPQALRLLSAFRATSGGLTTTAIREHLDILHPGARILELKAAGYRIDRQFRYVLGPRGSRHRVALYVYLGGPGEQQLPLNV